MSEYIPVLDKGKVITSVAFSGKYHLAVHDADRAPDHFLFMGCEQEYDYDEYCKLLQNLWEKYIDAGEKPKLLGLTLTDIGLVIETLHCIAPAAWDYSSRLLPCRESFAYWLKSKSQEIQARIGKTEFGYFDRDLEAILGNQIASKQRKDNFVKDSIPF